MFFSCCKSAISFRAHTEGQICFAIRGEDGLYYNKAGDFVSSLENPNLELFETEEDAEEERKEFAFPEAFEIVKLYLTPGSGPDPVWKLKEVK